MIGQYNALPIITREKLPSEFVTLEIQLKFCNAIIKRTNNVSCALSRP